MNCSSDSLNISSYELRSPVRVTRLRVKPRGENKIRSLSAAHEQSLSIQIPFLAEVHHRIFVPNFDRVFATDPFKIFSTAGVRPIAPLFNIAVFHRVVMHVIQAREKMSLGSHMPFQRPMPDLSTACFVLAVPFERQRPVEISQTGLKQFYLIGLNKDMVMIRQNAPCEKVCCKLAAHFDKCGFTLGHPRERRAYHVRVFVARSGD